MAIGRSSMSKPCNFSWNAALKLSKEKGKRKGKKNEKEKENGKRKRKRKRKKRWKGKVKSKKEKGKGKGKEKKAVKIKKKKKMEKEKTDCIHLNIPLMYVFFLSIYLGFDFLCSRVLRSQLVALTTSTNACWETNPDTKTF